MSYCTQAGLIDRYGEDELIQLTSRNGLSIIDADVLNQAIDDADNEIDAYLSVRYTLPISPVPAVLERISCEITRYRLFNRARIEVVDTDYKNCIRFLEAVAAGKASIGVSTGGVAPDLASDSVQIESSGNMFSRDEEY